MTKILFVGDVVGEPGLAYLEANLPKMIEQHGVTFVIVNGENVVLTEDPNANGAAGFSAATLDRFFALGADLVTGGNHSWDGWVDEVFSYDRIIRPLNFSVNAAGRGAAIIEKDGLKLGVINLASRSALSKADTPYDAFQFQVEAWGEDVDMVFVDFHGESVVEKLTFGYAVAGRAVAVVGTHTHVPTLDTRILPGGTAYVTDVGMTGPGDGAQGYDPMYAVDEMITRFKSKRPLTWAPGPVELGAVLITCEGTKAVAIERLLADQ